MIDPAVNDRSLAGHDSPTAQGARHSHRADSVLAAGGLRGSVSSRGEAVLDRSDGRLIAVADH
jgi:hypothetical protein